MQITERLQLVVHFLTDEPGAFFVGVMFYLIDRFAQEKFE